MMGLLPFVKNDKIDEVSIIAMRRSEILKHIKTVNKPSLQSTVHTGGCGECQASCQSACKTSCTVGNQACVK